MGAVVLLLVGMSVAPQPASGAAVTTTTAAAPTGPGSWTIQPSNSTTTANGEFAAISCPASNWCMAVGAYQNAAGYDVGLIEIWNGEVWSTVPDAPVPGDSSNVLVSVSCPTSGFCMVVGDWLSADDVSEPLLDEWNGQGMTRTQPVLDLVPVAVACSGPGFCLAVGDGANPAETWNGSTWTAQPAGQPSGDSGVTLDAVSCPATDFCAAGGQTDVDGVSEAAVETWNGSRLSSASVEPDDGHTYYGGEYSYVDCPTSAWCYADGWQETSSGQESVADSWNGSSWTLTAATDPEGPVGCSSPGACTIVDYLGDSGVNVYNWDGSAWNLSYYEDPTPDIEGDAIVGLACPGSQCLAVGFSRSQSAPAVTPYVWSGNESAWSEVTASEPLGLIGDDSMEAVSCPAPGSCISVGDTDNGIDGQQVSWSLQSGRWTEYPVTAPYQEYPPGSASYDSGRGLDCLSTSDCLLVGASYSDDGPQDPWAAAWNGSTWSTLNLPSPTDATQFEDVSCSTSHQCLVLGSAEYPDANGGNGASQGFVDYWNGSSWATDLLPDIDGQMSVGQAVSCTTDGECHVLAETDTSEGAQANSEIFAFVDGAWSGSALQGQAQMTSLSCVVGWCMSAGASYDTSTSEWSAVYATSADGWVEQPSVPQDQPIFAGFGANDLSCASQDFCMLLDGSATGLTREGDDTWEESTWNGSGWTLVPGPTSPDTATADAVDCLAGPVCQVVGSEGPDQPRLVSSELSTFTSGDSTFSATWAPVASSQLQAPPSYRIVTSGGAVYGVYQVGPDANFDVEPSVAPRSGYVAGFSTEDGDGYTLVAANGAVYAYGDAVYYGGANVYHPSQPIVAAFPSPDRGGYTLVTARGGIFNFGDARFEGSGASLGISTPVVAAFSSPDGGGYTLVAAGGGVFTFGDAGFWGSGAALHPSAPIVGAFPLLYSADIAEGYTLVDADGDSYLLTFGQSQVDPGLRAPVYPVVAVFPSLDGGGFTSVQANGAVESFGDGAFDGGLNGQNLGSPIAAAFPGQA